MLFLAPGGGTTPASLSHRLPRAPKAQRPGLAVWVDAPGEVQVLKMLISGLGTWEARPSRWAAQGFGNPRAGLLGTRSLGN